MGIILFLFCCLIVVVENMNEVKGYFGYGSFIYHNALIVDNINQCLVWNEEAVVSLYMTYTAISFNNDVTNIDPDLFTSRWLDDVCYIGPKDSDMMNILIDVNQHVIILIVFHNLLISFTTT